MILTRHGLGYLIGLLGLEQFVPFHRGWFKHPRRDNPYTRHPNLTITQTEIQEPEGSLSGSSLILPVVIA